MKVGRIGQVAAGLAVMALAMAQAVPAGAYALEFSQTTGFHSTTGTLQGIGSPGPAAVAGQGGLEYFTKITAPPGPPVGDSSVPPDIFQIVGWGCQAGNISAATCANGGVIGSTTSPGSNPFTNPFRSSLQVLGQSGNINNVDWVDITIINHHNNPISGNVLATVGIDSFLRFGPTGIIVDDPAPHTVTINFTETSNFADTSLCTASPGSGAPVNPLGSGCDDFAFVSAIDLDSVAIPANSFGGNPDMVIDFRLDPRLGALVCTGLPGQPAACGSYSGSAVIIYTDESDIHGLAVQARLRFIGIPEPASLLLLGTGLLGTAALAARRRRHS